MSVLRSYRVYHEVAMRVVNVLRVLAPQGALIKTDFRRVPSLPPWQNKKKVQFGQAAHEALRLDQQDDAARVEKSALRDEESSARRAREKERCRLGALKFAAHAKKYRESLERSKLNAIEEGERRNERKQKVIADWAVKKSEEAKAKKFWDDFAELGVGCVLSAPEHCVETVQFDLSDAFGWNAALDKFFAEQEVKQRAKRRARRRYRRERRQRNAGELYAIEILTWAKAKVRQQTTAAAGDAAAADAVSAVGMERALALATEVLRKRAKARGLERVVGEMAAAELEEGVDEEASAAKHTELVTLAKQVVFHTKGLCAVLIGERHVAEDAEVALRLTFAARSSARREHCQGGGQKTDVAWNLNVLCG